MLGWDVSGWEENDILCLAGKPVVRVPFMHRHPVVDFTKLAEEIAIHRVHVFVGWLSVAANLRLSQSRTLPLGLVGIDDYASQQEISFLLTISLIKVLERTHTRRGAV